MVNAAAQYAVVELRRETGVRTLENQRMPAGDSDDLRDSLQR
jgi:hypothetical protein